jgi:hypothetical protein
MTKDRVAVGKIESWMKRAFSIQHSAFSPQASFPGLPIINLGMTLKRQ